VHLIIEAVLSLMNSGISWAQCWADAWHLVRLTKPLDWRNQGVQESGSPNFWRESEWQQTSFDLKSATSSDQASQLPVRPTRHVTMQVSVEAHQQKIVLPEHFHHNKSLVSKENFSFGKFSTWYFFTAG